MDKYKDIRYKITEIAGRKAIPAFTAKVVASEGETCTVEIDGVKFNDVRLRAVVNGAESRLLITPEKGSYVLCADLSGGAMSDLAVLTVSEIAQIEIDTPLVVVNGGTNAGMVKIKELTDKLNTLVRSFNLFVQQYNAHLHNVTVPGAPTGPAMPMATTAEQFRQGDYEDKKFKH
jgi:hypothetical protein